ncbi:hypothetical protein IscW_ISCW009834 [Ixodes scapularis]|uniref:Uncharacterized protein n=1 Tax=Ixodes scapularis TaxID=6945 RepID=B7Q249_IXOSC|nr:hypothetical protein IscW_ISCW009834 [Ixodes scapularis]|eukprot:XP_002410459.1 hypothetical protein IscW_ISCW009834 [Ixodes scapularis]
MEYTIKEGLLWTAIEKLLELQNKLLGTNNLPESKYLFRQFAGTSADEVSFHFYCPKCETHLRKTAGGLKERDIWFTCSPCAERYLSKDLMSTGSYFVGLPLETQLASVLADETVREQLAASLAARDAPRSTVKSDGSQGATKGGDGDKLLSDVEERVVGPLSVESMAGIPGIFNIGVAVEVPMDEPFSLLLLEYEEKLLALQRHVIALRKNRSYLIIGQIENTNETPIFFGQPSNYVVDVRGSKEVRLRSIGN